MRIILLTLLSLSYFTGCTLIGGIIGSASTSEEKLTRDNINFNELEVGSKITINTTDNMSITGNLNSVVKIDKEEYQKGYQKFIDDGDYFDQPLILSEPYRINGTKTPHKFTGYDFGGLYFDSLRSHKSNYLPLNELTFLLDQSGNKFTNSQIRQLYANQKLQLKSVPL